MHATEVGDVVERASHKAVASPACRSRRLLVAQQVTAATFVGRDKALRDLIALWTSLGVFPTLHPTACGDGMHDPFTVCLPGTPEAFRLSTAPEARSLQ
jgi:hypothetical protein